MMPKNAGALDSKSLGALFPQKNTGALNSRSQTTELLCR
jgi:hypothetical protein